MDRTITGITLLISAAFAVGATVVAIVALFRGDSLGKTLRTWIRRLIDAITGIG